MREYRGIWPCVSSKKRYHDVVGVSRLAKMGLGSLMRWTLPRGAGEG